MAIHKLCIGLSQLYIHTHIHTYIHTYIYTYIHIYALYPKGMTSKYGLWARLVKLSTLVVFVLLYTYMLILTQGIWSDSWLIIPRRRNDIPETTGLKLCYITDLMRIFFFSTLFQN